VKPVFLDTVGLVARWDRNDQWHEPASRAFAALSASRAPVVTTSYVIAECANAVARTPFRLQVDVVRTRLEAASRLIFPTEADWRSAWDAYRRGDAGQAGLVDQLSFVVMRRLALTQAFTNDRHFQAAGFEVLF
jgi:predicted nucleic acid-binding protein